MSRSSGDEMSAEGWLSPSELAKLPEEHETRTDAFLAGTVHPADERDDRKFRRFTPYASDHFEDVPISQLRGGQTWVDTHRVYDLARSEPNDPRLAEQQPLVGTRRHDGTVMLEDGHHRAAAAAMRGQQFARVRLSGAYGHRFDLR